MVGDADSTGSVTAVGEIIVRRLGLATHDTDGTTL